MLQIDGVRRTYQPVKGMLRALTRTATDVPVEALRGIDLTVRRGRIVGLVGPNGAGKTTLIRIIAGLLDPDEGHVLVNGHDPVAAHGAAARSLGLVLADDRSLYWRLTGRQNLEFHAALYGLSRPEAAIRAGEVLATTGLEDSQRKVFGYSTGMRARLAIARALVPDPPVLVLDEPTRSLDPLAARDTCDLLRGLADGGRAVLLASHRLEELERIADDIAVLLDGRIVFLGTVEDLRVSGDTIMTRLERLLDDDRLYGSHR
jgi:ABC-2 type transport system ATP-binding protein